MMCFTTVFLVGLLATVPVASPSSVLHLHVREDHADWDNLTLVVESRRKDNDTLKYFDRDTCLGFAEWLLQDAIIKSNDSSIFANSSSNGLLNGPDNMTLTLRGCELICGKMTYYVDTGPRFMTWILPIALLLTNIELSATDKWRYYSLAQVSGNPVDALWSMVHKLQTWNRIYSISQASIDYSLDRSNTELAAHARAVGAVLAGFEELVGSKADELYFEQILRNLKPWDQSNWKHWEEAAVKLSDARTDGFARTTFVIALYILQVASAFLKEIGGEPPTPPGGVIACAVFLSYLVPTAIISNCIGAFTSRRVPFDILSHLVSTTTELKPGVPKSRLIGNEVNDWRSYFYEFHYKNGNHTYRPSKANFSSPKQASVSVLTALLCTLPVLAGFAGAVPILLYAVPAGFGCRHLWLVIVFGLWMVSLLVSTALHSNSSSKRSSMTAAKKKWLYILVFKDLPLGFGSLLIINLSAMGQFNSCWCWGRALFTSYYDVSIPLNTTETYVDRARNLFPGIVWPILGFQALFSGVVVLVGWRGITLMRWMDRYGEGVWQGLWGRVGTAGARDGEDMDGERLLRHTDDPRVGDGRRGVDQGEYEMGGLDQQGLRVLEESETQGQGQPSTQPQESTRPDPRSDHEGETRDLVPQDREMVGGNVEHTCLNERDQFHGFDPRFYLILWKYDDDDERRDEG